MARLDLIERHGPGPLAARYVFERPDHSLVIRESRAHRKHLHRVAMPLIHRVRHGAWDPDNLNWWIGILFALGSALFIIGSRLILTPALGGENWLLQAANANPVFLAGSVPFTLAAYLQLYQSANRDPATPHEHVLIGRRRLFGWRPRDIGWLSCALQFPGTLMFNVNTFDALQSGFDWLQKDLAVWVPDIVGSVLFLGSGYLAFAEVEQGHWPRALKDYSWWATAWNLFGCIAFMISAVLAFVPPTMPSNVLTIVSVAFTLLGAVGFLIGSLLLLAEAARPPDASAKDLETPPGG